MKIVIIGGGTAGTTCAFELRKIDKDIEISIIEKSSNLEYSPCALPYVLSGEIKKFDEIFIFDKKYYESNNINLFLNSSVKKIDKKKKEVYFDNKGIEEIIKYDKVILALGSGSFVPKINGLENTDYFLFRNIEDAKKIYSKIKKGNKSAVIGAGMIGLELAFSLNSRGEKVTLIEARKNILPNLLDNDIAKKLEEYLIECGIKVLVDSRVDEIKKNNLFIKNEKIFFDKLFLCAGVMPNKNLAEESGLKTDKGIWVNEYLKTSDADIYSCGDCVESIEFNSGKRIISALGTTAVRQSKVIAKNILGKKEKFSSVLNNTVTKVGDYYVGSVGLNEERAKELGIKTISAKYTSTVRAEYYSKEEKITIKLVCDDKGKILGSQIIGNSEVVGRLDLIALAIQEGLSIKKISKLETAYNPATAPIFDPLTIVADIILRKLELK